MRQDNIMLVKLKQPDECQANKLIRPDKAKEVRMQKQVT